MRAKYQIVNLLPESLQRINIFSELSPEAHVEIVRHCQGRRYRKRAPVVLHQDSQQDVFFVLSGRVNASILSPTGRQVTFDSLGAGEMFGELAVIDSRRRCASVVTAEETVLVHMSPSRFRWLMSTFPGVSYAVMRRMSLLIRRLCERLYEFHALSLRDRIHAEIWRVVNAQGYLDCEDHYMIDRPPTHADIASRVGTNREAVTREISVLCKEGIVERKPRKLLVYDTERLRSSSQDERVSRVNPRRDRAHPLSASA